VILALEKIHINLLALAINCACWRKIVLKKLQLYVIPLLKTAKVT